MSLIALAAAISLHIESDGSVTLQGRLARIVRDFDIPAQPLGDALTAYSQQSQLQMLFDTTDVSDLHGTSAPVRGHMSVAEAGRQLLAGNRRLAFSLVNPRTLAVVVLTDPEVCRIKREQLQALPPQHFEIPTTSVLDAVDRVFKETRLEFFWLPPPDFTHVAPVHLSGEYRPLEAVDAILAGTGLRRSFVCDSVSIENIPLPRRPTPIHKAMPVDEPTPRECVCAQSPDGIPLGPWCWEGDELHHVPACRAPTPDMLQNAR
jgi:hypothetical protein